MKKLLFVLFALVFTLSSKAQNPTNCSSLFVYTINGNTVSFVPAVIGDSATTRHLWYLGDGRVSDTRRPVITYAQCGTYTVKHVFKVLNNVGAVICADSTTVPVIIPCQQWCELTANFNFTVQPSSNGTTVVNFTNTSTNLLATDSCFWNFGDGTTAIGASPSHTYPANGVYTVCLRI
ncbi:MAG: PKD domain-containing protein, partial [Chitinophagaceae bacterium]|nr:PKD domain-containing protein [Chitinophagaceae bacterium]